MVLEVSKIDHEVVFGGDDVEKNDKKESNASVGLGNIKVKKMDSKNESGVKDEKINNKSKL